MTACGSASATAGSLGHRLLRLCVVPLCAVVLVLVLMTGSVCDSKPTIMFPFPASLTASLPSLSSYTRQFVDKTRGRSDQMKMYSGFRVSNDSLVMIYWHDQTIAIVELGPAKLLLNCEIIEIIDDKEGQRVLHKLGDINRPLHIQFKEMLLLMEQCQIVDRQNEQRQLENSAGPSAAGAAGDIQGRGENGDTSTTADPNAFQSPLTLFSGIIPGTKWCGSGDIASTYADLGAQPSMDRCCRSHDLCPAKVRAHQTRYGLENTAYYTKSHCACDDMLFACLKRANTSSAQVLGSIFFNLLQVECVQYAGSGKATLRRAREGF